MNFNAINPIHTENHNVKTRIITLRISAVETSIPFSVSKPTMEPSVIPIPAGIKEIAPKRIEVV